MRIIYNESKKDLSSERLHELFVAVGWSDGTESADMIQNYNIPFRNATLVVSAWEEKNLVGVVRVLSDKMFRSVIYDLIVFPDFQNKGIGKELVKRCIAHFPNSEWLVGTTKDISGFYEKIGFRQDNNAGTVFVDILQTVFER